MKHTLLIVMLGFAGCLPSAAQDTNNMIQSANDMYKQQQYEKAELAYDKVLERDRYNVIAKFNQANTYFRRSKKDDAVKAFDYLTSDGRDNNLREKAFYNKGVVLTRQEKLEESIEAYKNSLRLNPADTLARENLQKAMLALKKSSPLLKRKTIKRKRTRTSKKRKTSSHNRK